MDRFVRALIVIGLAALAATCIAILWWPRPHLQTPAAHHPAEMATSSASDPRGPAQPTPRAAEEPGVGASPSPTAPTQ